MITLPNKMAKILNVKAGDIVSFLEDSGNVILKKMK